MTKYDEETQRGLDMMDQVYGKGGAGPIESLLGNPYVDETVKNLFGKVWNRPGLSVRDRRLLVIGATAMMGRGDLVQIQVKGALINGELTKDQLDEMCLHLAFYVGWGKTTSVMQGVAAAVKAYEDEKAAK